MKKIEVFTKLILFVGFLSVFTNLNAQFHSMNFDYLTAENGLSNNRVQCILRDSKGYLWVGTEEGLNKYDGQKSVVFKTNAAFSNSISGNTILSILEDKSSNLWVGTTNGLNLYDRKTDTFKRYLPGMEKNTLSSTMITSIIEDKNGDIWVSTANGLNRWNKENDDFCRFTIEPTESKDLTNYITRMAMDKDGLFWLVTLDNKLWRFDSKSSQFNSYSDPSISNSSNILKEIVADESGTIWIGIRKFGLFSFKTSTGIFQQYNTIGNGKGTNGGNILYLILDGNQFLYIAVDHGGINRMNLQTKTFEYCLMDERNPKGLNSDALWSLYKDNEGILYAGTGAGGINIYNPKQDRFVTYKHHSNDNNSLIFNVVFRFFEDSEGLIWIVTDGGGVSVFNPVNKSFKNYQHNSADPYSISSNTVLAVTEDKNKDIWLGMWGNGLNRFDRKSGKFYHFMPNPNDPRAISNQDIWDLFTDKNGNIWVSCAFLGVDLFDIKKGVIQRYRPNSPSQELTISRHTNRIVQQQNGKIGFATDNGYFEIDSKTNTIHSDKRFDNYNLQDVYLDTKGNYWAGTIQKGLKLIKPNGTVETFDESTGLPSNSVSGILEDEQGNIWILSTAGLSEYSIQTKKIRHFTVLDGLQGKQFARFARLKAKDGTIYIGGSNGFNVFHPDKIKVNPYAPPVYIDEFQIFNEPVTVGAPNSPLSQTISTTKNIELSYKQSVFSFGFTAINYTNPEKALYAYKMEGYDKKWNYTNAQRRYVTYTNLAPGSYTFMVKATNNDEVWNETPTTLNIRITPPFWKTWWADLIYIVCFIMALAVIRQSAVNKERRKNKLALERSEFNKAIELEKKEREIDQAKLNFFTNISHELRTPLTLILGPLNYFFDHKAEVNWSSNEKYFVLMKRNADKLLYLINTVLDIRKLDSGSMKLSLRNGDIIEFVKTLADTFVYNAEHKQINFTIVSSHPNYNGWFDADVIDKIVSNLLSNAFKFTPEKGEIAFDIKIFGEGDEDCISSLSQKNIVPSGDFLKLEVRDTGVGILPEQKEKIFDRFYQADNATNRLGGSGIGLALVKELVELLKGAIEVESTVGQGSCFRVWLPISNTLEQSDSYVEKINSIEIAEAEATGNDIAPDIETTQEPEILEKPLVLIVEDNEDMAEYISSILQEEYTVLIANNGQRGLEMAIENIPDLIVSDVMMPEVNGFEMSKLLRNDERTSHVPIILLTARTAEESQIEGLETGVDDYLTKPFNAKILQLKVSNTIQSRHLLREKFSFTDGNNSTSFSNTSNLNILDEKFIQKARSIVEKHLSNPDFDPQLFANEIAMSRTQLYRKLKAVTNQTVNDFIWSVRLDIAKKMLLNGDKNITEVGYDVGYKFLAHFSKSFTKQYGISPSKFIEQHRKN